MCAIAGALNCGDLNLDPMQRALLHRGPDEQSRYTHQNLTLLHNRLAIVDIKDGHQPMHYGPYTLIFNGEIYNHLELREELKEFPFKTQSDTETLLFLLIKYGIKGLEKVDGMFAVAFLDKESGTLTLIRDRMGKKPLYYYKKGERFIFASEIGAIAKTLKLRPHEQHVGNYLRCGYFYGDSTVYRDLFSLEAGVAMTVDLASTRVVKGRWFDLMDIYRRPNDLLLEEALAQSDTLLHRSVKNRIISSDLEVGAFLSGGIDSGLVVAAASEYAKNLKTFTVAFEGAYDESVLAAQVAQKYRTDHTVIDIRMDVKNDLKKILGNYSQPFFDSSAIPSYYVSQAAKKHVTVVLNGDGADELFGGYRRYVPVVNGWVNKAAKLSWLSRFLPGPADKKSLYSHLFRLLEMAGKKDPLAFYLSGTTDIFEGFETHLAGDHNGEMREYLGQIYESDLSDLAKLMLSDDSCLLVSNLLVKMDIATMAHSLEARSPFMSKYFVEFAPALADTLKVNGKTTKFLLRKLSERYLPEALPTQPKRGFEIPLKRWVEEDLDGMIRDYLGGTAYSENFVERGFIDNLLSNKIKVPAEKRARMLWAMLSLEIWWEANPA